MFAPEEGQACMHTGAAQGDRDVACKGGRRELGAERKKGSRRQL